MKRFWLLALLMAGSLTVALSSPASAAKMDEGTNESSADQSQAMDDFNSALGSMAAHINDIDKKLGLSFFGDVRARYVLRTQQQSDPTDAAALNKGTNTITDAGFGRYRARVGARETLGDFTGTLRIATGSPTNPNSENQTFDNGFANPGINIDQAYLTYVPGYLKDLKVMVGKMAQPLAFTPASWDGDINPEGALLEYNVASTDTKLRATYYDLVNMAGTNQGVAGGVTNTGAANDEYMANFQIEQLMKLDNDTKVDLTLGYEYIPNATALATGAISPAANGIGPGGGISTSNTPANAGNIFDFGNTIPDFEVGEALLTVNHKVGDVPFKWTAHFIDNFNSFDVPNTEGVVTTSAKYVTVGSTSPVTLEDTTGAVTTVIPAQAVTAANPTTTKIYAPTGTKAANGYSNWTNQYGFYGSVKAGDSGTKGAWAGTFAVGYEEPNAQLACIADDDANFTNAEYLYQQISYGLENNVQLLVSAWELQRLYYSYLGPVNNNLLTKTGAGSTGTSQDPEYQIYVDALVNF